MTPYILNSKTKNIIRKYKITKALMPMALLLVLTSFSGLSYLRNPYYITDGENTIQVYSMERDPQEILAENDYNLGKHDEVELAGEDANEIVIKRAFDVTVKCDGESITIPVTEATVGEAIDAAGIKLNKNDEVSRELSAKCMANTVIEIDRVLYKNVVIKENIPYETEYKASNILGIGESYIETMGVLGTLSIEKNQKYINGEMVQEKTVSADVTAEPVNEVVVNGTARRTPYSKDNTPADLVLDEYGYPVNYTNIISGKATAYTAGINARTASGRKAEIGTVAVNPNIIPYGTELYIVSKDGKHVYGYAIAADTGIALMEGICVVDLYMGDTPNHYADACNWGAKQVDIYVLS